VTKPGVTRTVLAAEWGSGGALSPDVTRNGGAPQREPSRQAGRPLAESDPGVDQARFPVFFARNVGRNRIRSENRGDRLENAQSGAPPSGGQAGASTSVGGENLIAFDLDRLFRAERRPNADLEYPRAEAARILLTTASHRGLQPEDRAYLVRLTAVVTGIAEGDAQRRVDDVAARAKEDISRARRTAVILAFFAGAAALVGAAVAWFAASVGGRVRDGEMEPHTLLNWGRPRL
jgi:hypothetical protein